MLWVRAGIPLAISCARGLCAMYPEISPAPRSRCRWMSSAMPSWSSPRTVGANMIGNRVECLVCQILCGVLFVAAVSPLAHAAAAPAPGPATAPVDPDAKPFKPEELEALVANIALYPDSVLAQIFMASTYPLEIVQAERWVNENKELKG